MQLVDAYDDGGQYVKACAGDTYQLDVIQADVLDRSPDRLFACVYDSPTGGTVRKLAMHDPGQLTTSMIYFLAQADQMPDAARTKVASNLLAMCHEYEMPRPQSVEKILADGLEKVAVVGAAMGALTAGMGAMDVLNTSRSNAESKRQFMDEFRRAQASGAKVADLNGTDIMGQLGQRTPNAREEKSVVGKGSLSKQAGTAWHRLEPADLETPAEVPPPPFQKYAMPHRRQFPIGTTEQVKAACAYFDDNWTLMTPRDRRIYANHVVDQLDKLGAGVKTASDYMLEYVGTEYGPHVGTELRYRSSSLQGSGRNVGYDLLLEKLATTPPLVMVSMIEDLDAATGLDSKYGRGVGDFRDPYRAVFGSKTAGLIREEPTSFLWENEGFKVDGEALHTLARVNSAELDNLFGTDFMKEYRKDPVGIFKSLPDPQKAVLARMAK